MALGDAGFLLARNSARRLVSLTVDRNSRGAFDSVGKDEAKFHSSSSATGAAAAAATTAGLDNEEGIPAPRAAKGSAADAGGGGAWLMEGCGVVD